MMKMYMGRFVLLLVSMYFFTDCSNCEVIYQIPDTSICIKVIDGGRWTRPYKTTALVCVSDTTDKIMFQDTIIAWKGVDWNWPMVMMINPSKLDTLFFESNLGADAVYHNRVLFKVYRFSPIPDNAIVNDEMLIRRDTLFFSGDVGGPFRIKAPFFAVHFDEKFEELYLERPDSPGEKMKLFPSSKRISLRSFLRKNRPLLLPEIVDRIENYKRNKKRLPKSLTELGINDPLDLVGIHYEERDNTYALYYHAGFEEYYVYRSETRSWEVEHCEK